MKKLLFSLCFGVIVCVQAQDIKKDTSYWTKAGSLNLNASLTQLSDWQGGGQNNVALNGIFNYDAKYKKDKIEWVNKFDGQLGFIRPGDVEKFRKNIDQIFALSKFNVNAFNKYWFYAAQADYRTQFSPGYNYQGDIRIEPAVSDFNSPGYTQLAIGLDFKPTNYFSATFAPLAGKITSVNRQYLADAGAYGVDKAVVDSAGQVVTPGKRLRAEFGGRVILKFKKDLYKKGNYAVNLDSYLDLFSNYIHNPGNIDVVFNNLLNIKLSRFLTANFICQMVYDDDIIRKRDLNGDGLYNMTGEINGPRLQILSTFSFGFGYKF